MLDPILRKGLQARDLKALETLYDRHAGVLWHFALGLAGRADWAEQALEAAFCAVWKSSDTAAPPLLVQLLSHCRAQLAAHPDLAARLKPEAISKDAAMLVLQGLPLDQVALAFSLSRQDLSRALRLCLFLPTTTTTDVHDPRLSSAS
jgi:hypothetical protein